MNSWSEADKRHLWHPFTRQQEWCAENHHPVVITRGAGVWLWDDLGRKFFDGNSSIWTNIHGHAHPEISSAIARQAETLDHSSFLGFTHPGAVELAGKLCGFFPVGTLERVFFSDNGSTAVECALKMAVQFRLQTGAPGRVEFAAFADGYHGDTLGAASLGGVSRFFERFRSHGYPVHHVASAAGLAALDHRKLAAVIIEPLIQGVNQMRPWPAGMLREISDWCDAHGVHLILDEVMTGFGRTGSMFACQRENVTPDFLCLAKGLSGGALPIAATLTTAEIYDAFLGPAENAFYYGHSYTANPLACAAALANLRLFETNNVLASLPEKASALARHLSDLARKHAIVFATRRCGLISGIEIRRPDGRKFPPELRSGEKICALALRHGLLTRPILDTLVFMPPLSTTSAEMELAFQSLDRTLTEFSETTVGNSGH